jgi:predicted small lipoprotein YifL
MARTAREVLKLGLVTGLIAVSLAGCGRRGSLEAPPGAMPNAPDVTTRQPQQKPPEAAAEPKKDVEPQPKPDRVLETPAP